MVQTQKKDNYVVKGKRLKTAYSDIDRAKLYALNEAVTLIKSKAKAKFDETIEISLNLGIDVKQSDQAVRGTIVMPKGVGKKVRVAVFAKDAKAEEAKKAGADLVGSEELIEKVAGGAIEFDRCIATPDMMAALSKAAKVLGPRGLMPNPKLGTVTQDIATAVKNAKSGQVQFRAEKGGIVHAGIGKASFSETDLLENIKAFIEAVKQAKPEGVKGVYLKRAAISSTMGPGIKLDVSTLAA
jgi:large subunit ribosomal protein L1